jgi:hypothetical protein
MLIQARESKCQPRKACTRLFQRHRHRSPKDKECTAWSRQQSSGPRRRQHTSQRRWPQPSWSTCPRRTADTWSRQWHPRQWSTCPRDRTSRQQRRQGATWAQTFQRDIPGSLPSWCCQCWPCTFLWDRQYTLQHALMRKFHEHNRCTLHRWLLPLHKSTCQPRSRNILCLLMMLRTCHRRICCRKVALEYRCTLRLGSSRIGFALPAIEIDLASTVCKSSRVCPAVALNEPAGQGVPTGCEKKHSPGFESNLQVPL